MFMDKIHGLEDMIINVSSLLNLIYKSDAIQMKIPVKFFFVELDEIILILIWKIKKKSRKEALRQFWRGVTKVEGTFHRRYENLL